MYAIASLPDPITEQAIRRLWDRFEQNCGITRATISPLPHFTWMGAEDYALEPLEDVLAEIARQIKPFSVLTSGLGIFTGLLPIVYVALVKDALLLDIQQLIWEKALQYSVDPNPHYQPRRWIPHITLAHKVDPIRLGCAIGDLAFQPIEHEILVDHFAIIYYLNHQGGIYTRFRLGTGEQFR